MDVALGREQGFGAIGRWCESKGVLWQPRPSLVDFLPGGGRYGGQFVRSNSNDRTILSVEVDEVVMEFPLDMGPDEREA